MKLHIIIMTTMLVCSLDGTAQSWYAPGPQPVKQLKAPNQKRLHEKQINNIPRGTNVNVTDFIGSRDADSRTWMRVVTSQDTNGKIHSRTNTAYVELATGMHYWENGQWNESKEIIEPFSGGAIARHGQHKVSFANNLNTAGAIDMQMPDGKELQSDVLGLSYYDTSSGKSVLIAQIKGSQGQIVSSNQVIYANAFDGVSADVRYTYRRDGLEQDIVLQAQPPSPQNYGLNPTTTRLQVLTEFLNPPQPIKYNTTNADGTVDESLDFGAVRMGLGIAFSIGGNEDIPVAKQWTQIDGRTILIESIPVKLVQTALQALPLQSSLSKQTLKWQVASKKRFLPALSPIKKDRQTMLVGQNSPSEHGLVLDYNTLIAGSYSGYTFQGNMTYEISGNVILNGAVTFEGGAVIKYDRNTGNSYVGIVINSPGQMRWLTSPYHPAIFTAVDDCSVGEVIGTFTTAYPSGYYAYYALSINGQAATIQNARFLYAHTAIQINAGANVTLNDVQILNCSDCMFWQYSSATKAMVRNCLFANDGFAFDTSALTGYPAIVSENVTFASVNLGLWSSSIYYYYPAAYFTNCILANVAASSYVAAYINGGANNGVYQFSWSPSSSWPFPGQIITSQNPFQSVGGGNYYLADNSGFRGQGTANVDSTLTGLLKHGTTHPPFVLPALMEVSRDMTFFPQVPRYASGAPDLGYYYDALDYTISGLYLEGGNTTVEPGTAIGFRSDSLYAFGFDVWEGANFTSLGLPAQPDTFVDVQLVQEQLQASIFASFVPDFVPGPENPAPPFLNFRFSNFYLKGDSYLYTPAYQIFSGQSFFNEGYYEISLDSVMSLTIRDCNFYDGQIDLDIADFSFDPSQVLGSSAVAWSNCLFDRVSVALLPTYYSFDQIANIDFSFQAYNNLFHGGDWFALSPNPSSSGNWVFEDNLFDQVDFYQDTTVPLDYDYNGYWPLPPADLNGGDAAELQPTTTGDSFTDGGHEQILSSAPPYQTGPLGNYYLPASTPLYNGGSRSAADAGLAQYTTLFSQIKDSGQVDIGLHYVATSSSISTTPKDTDNDGVPDYVEDANGNGVFDVGTETDWQNNYSTTDPNTQESVADSVSAIYDDVDLSGDGLVGRIKKALGMTPFDTSNPLKLTQVTPSYGPEGVLFEVPLNYDSLNGTATVQLGLGGEPGPGVQGAMKNSSDGHVLLVWNSTFDPAGQHYLQPQLILDTFDQDSDQPITMAMGPLVPYESDNQLQFDTVWASYDSSGATLYAQTSPGASYSIALTDANGNPLPVANFTGNADGNGVIDVFWQNLLESDGQTPYAGNSFNATFTIGDPNTYTEQLSRLAVPSGDGAFTVAYACLTPQSLDLCGKPNDMDVMIENGVVEPLWDNPNYPYDSAAFNYNQEYDPVNNYGDAGFVASPADVNDEEQTHTVAQLLTSLSTATGFLSGKNTKNFYWFGHGEPDQIMNGLSGDSAVVIKASDVGSALGNYTEIVSGGIFTDPVAVYHLNDPYRFVFIDGCNTAQADNWPYAFGIPTYEWSEAYAETHSDKASAYIGFNEQVYSFASGSGVINDDEWECPSYTYTLNIFFSLWGDGNSLDYCMTTCSHPGSLWTYFGQEGVQDDTTAFPDGEINVEPIGVPVAQGGSSPGTSRSGFSPRYGAATKYYGTRYLTRTGVQ